MATLFTGIGLIRDTVLTAELPAVLNTVEDLYNFLRIVASLGRGTYYTASGIANVSQEVISAFQSKSIKVPAGQVVDVLDQGVFSTYFSLSGLMGEIFSADTFDLLVMTADGSEVTMASTNPDYSWIVQPDRLMRSVYGTLHQPDPASGVYLFNVGNFVPPGT